MAQHQTGTTNGNVAASQGQNSDSQGKFDIDVPLYEMIDCEGESNPSYSVVSVATMNRENTYTSAAATSKTANKNRKVKDVVKSKKLISLMAILASAMLLMLMIGCLIALFLETANLKSKMALQTLPNYQTAIIMQQINENFSSLENRLEDITNRKAEQLNISLSSLIEETVNSNLQQLNTSILSDVEYRFQEVVSLQNSEVEQLNESLSSQIEDGINETVQQLNSSINKNIGLLGILLGAFYSVYPPTCAALPPSSPSGYYWVRASYGSVVRVYCDMTRSCGGVTGGWMRVAELDMTNSSHQCPSGLRQRTDSNLRTCVRDSDSRGCSSVTFSNDTLEYSRVCGKIIAYQVGTTDAFVATGHDSNPSINTSYVDGVSLTHGTPRQHIWTLAAAFHEGNGLRSCPCTNSNTAHQTYTPPAFVRNDYFCDTGNADPTTHHNIFYGDDPLWDGAGCGPTNICCSFNTPPWFYKQLPQPTTDDIEMRVCRDEDASNEDIAIEMVEIYIQ